MYQIRLGGLDIRVCEDTIYFSPAGSMDEPLRLDTAHRMQLIEFLAGYRLPGRDRRLGFRVPVNDELFFETGDRLTISALFEKSALEVRCRDISFSGVGLNVRAMLPETVSIGTKLSLIVSLGADSLSVKGVVRRVDRRFIGVSFESPIEEKSFEPPEVLIHIVRDLETRWLRRVRKTFWF